MATSPTGPLTRADPPRRSPRWTAWLWPAALAAFLVVLGAVLVHYGFRLWVHTYDEDVYRVTGRFTWDNLPSSLWSGTSDGRGLQRLQSWLLGFGIGIFGTPGGFKVVRIVDIAAYLSTAVPVWLWIRAFGVRRAFAAAGAALAVLVPWAVVTTTFMTEALAYPLTTLALYGLWRAATRPSPRWLVAAAVAIFVAMLARSVMVLLVAVLVVTLVLVALRFDARPAWTARRSWTARAVAPWVLLAAAVLAVLLVYLVHRSTLDPLTGAYSSTVSVNLGALPRLARWDLSYVMSGLGILPGVVALAWLARGLAARRPEREAWALGIVAILVTLLAAYSTMRAGPDERYIMYLAPPLVVAATVAVARRQIGLVSLGLATAFAIFLFAGVPWRQDSDPYAFYVSAAQIFHGRVLMLGIGSRLPDVGLSYALILAIGIVVVAALAGLALHRRDRAGLAVAGVLAIGLALLQLAQVLYVERHFTRLAQFGPPNLADRSWLDRAVGEDAHVGVFVTRTGADVNNLYESWREVAFFNQAKRTVFQVQGSVALDPLYGEQALIFINDRTGRLTSPAPIPRLMVELQITPKAPLAGTPLAYAGYVPFSVVRLAPGPPRLQWLVLGNDDASWTIPGQDTDIRVFKAAGAGRCLTVDFQPPPDLTVPRVVTVRSGGETQRVAVPPNGDAKARNVRLAGGTADAFADVVVQAHGSSPVLGAMRGVRVASIVRGACR